MKWTKVEAPTPLSALRGAYSFLSHPALRWEGRHTGPGQRLLCQMRDAIAESMGRHAKDVQDNEWHNNGVPIMDDQPIVTVEGQLMVMTACVREALTVAEIMRKATGDALPAAICHWLNAALAVQGPGDRSLGTGHPEGGGQ